MHVSRILAGWRISQSSKIDKAERRQVDVTEQEAIHICFCDDSGVIAENIKMFEVWVVSNPLWVNYAHHIDIKKRDLVISFWSNPIKKLIAAWVYFKYFFLYAINDKQMVLGAVVSNIFRIETSK